MDNSSGNVLKTIAYGISKTKLTKSINQKLNGWEKVRPTELKEASNKTSDP